MLRAIDISGVMPLPPERKRYLGAGCASIVNTPSGPKALSAMPGRRLSWSQFDTRPPGWRFTVIESRCGRVGGEEMV